jgi:DNA-binding response OmpR family regulator
MGIRDYLKDPAGRRGISRAIRGAFARRRGVTAASGRILVIDADPLMREALVRMLQRANYDVVGAADGDQALGLFDEAPFDLAITDTTTPDSDDLETFRALRRRIPELKIVAASSAASHHLAKPFDTEQLLQAIKRVLQE